MLLDAFVVESAADLDPAKCHVLLDIVAGRLGHDYLARIGLLRQDNDDGDEAAA